MTSEPPLPCDGLPETPVESQELLLPYRYQGVGNWSQSKRDLRAIVEPAFRNYSGRDEEREQEQSGEINDGKQEQFDAAINRRARVGSNEGERSSVRRGIGTLLAVPAGF